MPKSDRDIPSTLERSPKKAQRTYTETMDSAEGSYGKGQRAARAAWSAVKHSFEKVGDHWEEKDEKGPSDAQAKKTGKQARDSRTPTAGGVDVEGKTKQELYEQAQELDIEGRSSMDKGELGQAIKKANDKATRKARS